MSNFENQRMENPEQVSESDRTEFLKTLQRIQKEYTESLPRVRDAYNDRMRFLVTAQNALLGKKTGVIPGDVSKFQELVNDHARSAKDLEGRIIDRNNASFLREQLSPEDQKRFAKITFESKEELQDAFDRFVMENP